MKSCQNARGIPGRIAMLATLVLVANGCGQSTPSSPDAGTDAAMEAAADTSAEVASDAHVPKPGDKCTTRQDCDDGIFCNGVEECISGVCISARNSACRDHGGCAVSLCEESSGGCRVETTSDGAKPCPSGQTCLAELGCTPVEGCTSPTDAKCDDGRACTDDSCDVSTGACIHLPVDTRCPAQGDCGVGSCLGAGVSDPSGCGVNPDASKCKADQGCSASFHCAPLPPSCTSDHDCSDGTLCDGIERCVLGHCVHDSARTTCVPTTPCHHASCVVRALGDPYCADVALAGCKG